MTINQSFRLLYHAVFRQIIVVYSVSDNCFMVIDIYTVRSRQIPNVELDAVAVEITVGINRIPVLQFLVVIIILVGMIDFYALIFDK